jgi:hypothetical protein
MDMLEVLQTWILNVSIVELDHVLIDRGMEIFSKMQGGNVFAKGEQIKHWVPTLTVNDDLGDDLCARWVLNICFE